jgi:hypothetical protein
LSPLGAFFIGLALLLVFSGAFGEGSRIGLSDKALSLSKWQADVARPTSATPADAQALATAALR